MKKHLLSLLILLLCMSHNFIYSQEKMLILIDNTPFAPIDKLYNENTKYNTVEKLTADWPTYSLPKGLEVDVIGYDYDAVLRVELPDGSVGYIPTVAVAFPEVAFSNEADIDYSTNEFNSQRVYPAGEYVLESIGKWEYMKKLDQTFSVRPQHYVFKHESGKRFTITHDEISTMGGDLKARFIKWDGPAIFDRFFANHPDIEGEYELAALPFKLKDDELPTHLIGYSRSYIESVLGEPYFYVGYSVSQYNGYTFSCHTNVAWDIPDSKKRDDAGLVIYYDKNQIAVYMEKSPLDYNYDETYTHLYLPSRPMAEVVPGIADNIAASKRNGKPAYRADREVHDELYTEPAGIDKYWIKLMYLFEYEFGIFNRWAIIGILFGVTLVWSIIITLIVRYCLPFSNRTLKIIAIVLNLPVAILAILYISRFYIIIALFAGIMLVGFDIFFAGMLSEEIDENRCSKCRAWLNNPIVLHREEGRISTSYPSLTLNTGIVVDTSSGTDYIDGVKRSYSGVARNFLSTVRLSWPVIKTLKCPHCGHVWKYTSYDSEEVPGPIIYTSDTKSTDSWKETEITKRQLINTGTSEVLYEEEVGRRTVNRTKSGPGHHSSRYNADLYNPYLRRYVNGDRKALTEYVNKYYGRYWGD